MEHGSYIASGQWSHTESLRSSTWRELRAVELTGCSLLSELSGHRVKWYTDNQNVACMLLVGSRRPDLHDCVFRIFLAYFNNAIVLEPQWVPREQNVIADELSRIIDYDDWPLDPDVFLSFGGPTQLIVLPIMLMHCSPGSIVITQCQEVRQ